MLLFMGKANETIAQNPTKNNLVSKLEPGFPACIFASQLSKREHFQLQTATTDRNCREFILQVWRSAQLPNYPSALPPHSYTAE